MMAMNHYSALQKGHGIPDSLVNEIRSISRQFFHLPYEEKLKIKLSPSTGYRFCSFFFWIIADCIIILYDFSLKVLLSAEDINESERT